MQIFHAKKNKKNHIDIQTLDLTPADVSAEAEGDPFQCNGGADLSPGSSIVIQTPKYPRRYPNGKKGRCLWAFYFTASTKIELAREKVKKGNRFCITLWSGKKCFFGKRSESFKFPDSYVKKIPKEY